MGRELLGALGYIADCDCNIIDASRHVTVEADGLSQTCENLEVKISNYDSNITPSKVKSIMLNRLEEDTVVAVEMRVARGGIV